MCNEFFSGPIAEGVLRAPDTGVVMESLVDPPTRELPDRGMVYILDSYAERNPGTTDANWEPQDLTDTVGTSGSNIAYIPMGNSAFATFDEPGYLGTARLNGCTAATAIHRDKRGVIQAFEGHYDPESVRDVDEDGGSKLGGLVTAFAGEAPVRVCVAYAKDHNPVRTFEQYDPEYFPVEAILRSCQNLPNGSRVLFVPYPTSRDKTNQTIGHMLYAGRGGSDLVDVGWNGHRLDIGERETFTGARRAAARIMAAAIEVEAEAEDYLYEA